ncbi:MAG: flavodoxin family protein [Eggerthellaceae bacterium]|nr:flavodoxin family protein [Eggerthellaceae bacterium]
MAKNILVVHASPRTGGNSSRLADEFIRGAEEAGNAVTRVDVGHASIGGCKACEYCFAHEGQCVQQDDMQRFYPLLRAADVLVYATPMYYYNYPAQLRAFQDRMFCGIAKPFNIPQTALLLCFEDKIRERCEPLLASYRVCCEYCKQESLGEVVVNNVYEKGAIEGNPGLQEAYELGRSIS